MIFLAPSLLLALAALPLLWWLLRATPPAPRVQDFPAIRLLAGLAAREETPARTPPWLLALRMVAAGLLVVGLAGPTVAPGGAALPGSGPVLLVIDDGWASAADWPARLLAAESVLDRAGRAGRRLALLTTADGPGGEAPRLVTGDAAALRPGLAALRPKPWPVDRLAAAAAARRATPGPVFYLADGVASPEDAAFGAALAARGPVTELRGQGNATLLSARAEPARLIARLRALPASLDRKVAVLAETGDGRVLGRSAIDLPADATTAEAAVALPPELRNQLAVLRVEGVAGAGTVALLDESARRRPVGLWLAGAGSETPLLGPLFYLDRALAPTTELRRGDLATLLARKLSMLVVTDRTLDGVDADRVEAWVRQGGTLVRFAGPDLAAASPPDALLPEPLLTGDRQLGGSMSWSQPAHLAPFPAGPFAGLPASPEVTVSRQVLAEPSAALAAATWARLADGTPLVTAARHGTGEIVLFHVTANADWSNLPLSGLFVDMLGRLVRRSAGVAGEPEAGRLSPARTLDGAGILGPPGPAATGLTAAELAGAPVSARHPPGFYGSEQDRRAFNLGRDVTWLAPAAPVPGGTLAPLDAGARTLSFGPWLIALALALLAADMVLTLRLRGLLRPALAALALLAAMPRASAEDASPALATHLAYVLTGDAEVDATSRSGLQGLSDFVNSRTAAALAEPAPVTPGRDDLSFYPLLYWPITAEATASPAMVAALNDYMAHGGVVVIDTRGTAEDGAGSGAGLAPGTDAALKRVAAGLDIPRLAPLTTAHVLARAFYLLGDFPGRYDGGTVWVQQEQDRTNDNVSPVIIGGNDWAAAWATDEDGKPLYATIPGGQRQRTLAYRFGVNLVMYALTGNYKGDQVHVPAILERLGQ